MQQYTEEAKGLRNSAVLLHCTAVSAVARDEIENPIIMLTKIPESENAMARQQVQGKVGRYTHVRPSIQPPRSVDSGRRASSRDVEDLQKWCLV